MVQLAKEMKKEQGILLDPPTISKGKKISKEQKIQVASFFERDDISRQCPGKKDYLSVRDQNGVKQQCQKRLVLGNLKEIYQKFKDEEENPRIGFSSFCSLRPKYCVLAGSSGTHSVCVCTYHQNPMLQLNAIGHPGLSLEDVMGKAVCSRENEKCMMRRCDVCPGEDAVKQFIENLPELEGREEIRHKKWVTVDRCTLQDVVAPTEEFIESFSSSIMQLLRHHFVAKSQGHAFKEAKARLSPNEGVLVGDFAENYSFLVQDAAQGYHWDNSQCTLHPFVFYFKGVDSTIQHESFCFISDSTKHSTAMVYAFQKELIPLLQQRHPALQRIIYFSDGCAAQYKNCYNFINLSFHEEDFGITAEWNFFATSHGKNACDGIGGTLKRCVSQASLQRVYNNQITTAIDFFNYCKENISSIHCLFTNKQTVESTATQLQNRFSEAVTIKGTQKQHHFKPLLNGFMEIAELTTDAAQRSSAKIRKTAVVAEPLIEDESNQTTEYVGNYVVVKDSSKMWVAFVDHADEEFGDFFIKFLHPAGLNISYNFPPSQREQCFKSKDDIVGVLPEPTLIFSGSRVRYTFQKERLKAMMNGQR